MTLFVGRAGRVLLQVSLLLGAIATASPSHVLAKTTTMRYASSAYGYTLQLPSSWTRLAGVRWTLGGPAADLTIMTPDHQAAFGVIVTPTGSRVYSSSELQDVALRLLSQENDILPSVKLQTKKIVINGVPYETASGYISSGLPLMATIVAVLVTQRHHRLYALISLVYLQVFTTPAASGGEPTPTPEGNGEAPLRAPAEINAPSAGARVNTAPWGFHGEGREFLPQQPLDPPAPLPTDRLRGNNCRTVNDGGLAVVDRNCAFAAEGKALATAISTLKIDPRAEDDHRPAAPVSVDGFKSLSDPAQDYRVEYPAQWIRVPAPGTVAFLRSRDQNAGVGVTIAPIDADTLSEADLSAAADHQLALVASIPGALVHKTVHAHGTTFVIAYASGAGVTLTGGSLGQAQIVVVATAYHHRLYTTTGLGLTVLGANNDVTPILYPYFSPFTTLARRYQGLLDTHGQEAQLALRAALTLVVATPS